MNPFARLQNPTPWELCKISLGLCTLVPLRSLLVLLIVIFGGLCVLILHVLQCRTLSIWCLRINCRLLLFVLGFVHIQVVGNIPSPCPPVIVSNHISLIEAIHMVYLLGGRRGVAFVAKSSIFQIPVVGRLVRDVLQCIGVHRSVPGAAPAPPLKTATALILERLQVSQTTAATTSRNNPPLIIFPEGTTTNGNQLLSFKTGAFVARRPVLPLLYSFPASGSFVPTFESIWTPIYIVRTLSQPWNNLKCVLLAPMEPRVAVQVGSGKRREGR